MADTTTINKCDLIRKQELTSQELATGVRFTFSLKYFESDRNLNELKMSCFIFHTKCTTTIRTISIITI